MNVDAMLLFIQLYFTLSCAIPVLSSSHTALLLIIMSVQLTAHRLIQIPFPLLLEGPRRGAHDSAAYTMRESCVLPAQWREDLRRSPSEGVQAADHTGPYGGRGTQGPTLAAYDGCSVQFGGGMPEPLVAPSRPQVEQPCVGVFSLIFHSWAPHSSPSTLHD